jgi:hypothetical protein
VRATLGGPRDDREITHPTAPYLIDLGYEGIIGALHRLTGAIRGAVLAVKGARDGL